MALSDIVQRIDRDAVAESQAVVAEAQAQADALVNAAREGAEEARERTFAQAEREARAEAATLLATARLEARDRMLGARRELVDRVLANALEAVDSLADDAYAEVLARRIVATARGGERILIAGADVPRLVDRLPGAVARAGGTGLGLQWASATAPVAHGVVLRGDRVSVDLSLGAVVDERRDELAMLAAGILFGEAGD